MDCLITTSGVIPEGIWDSVVGGWGGWRSDKGSDGVSDGSSGVDTLAFFLGGQLPDFLAREELAPGAVGGLLVSYRLEWELKGASSTDGGMASGCEGPIMEPCTGVSLGALRRLEGDEDLAPRVFAMAASEKVAKGVRTTWAQMGSSRRVF